MLDLTSNYFFKQIPLSHISEAIYKTSTDWLNNRSFEALGSFVLWSMDSILADLAIHHGAAKGSKKVVQQSSTKSQVIFAIFLDKFFVVFSLAALALRKTEKLLVNIMILEFL